MASGLPPPGRGYSPTKGTRSGTEGETGAEGGRSEGRLRVEGRRRVAAAHWTGLHRSFIGYAIIPAPRPPMHEIVANLHTPTHHADGWCDRATIAHEALRAGLDVVAVTDHNVWVDGFDGYRYEADRRLLPITRQGIPDPPG